MKTSLRLAASLFLLAALFPLLTATGAATVQATDNNAYTQADTVAKPQRKAKTVKPAKASKQTIPTDTIILHVPDSVPVGNAKDAA